MGLPKNEKTCVGVAWFPATSEQQAWPPPPLRGDEGSLATSCALDLPWLMAGMAGRGVCAAGAWWQWMLGLGWVGVGVCCVGGGTERRAALAGWLGPWPASIPLCRPPCLVWALFCRLEGGPLCR